MNRTWKKYKVLLTAGAMAVCMTAGLGMGIRWSRSHTEKAVVEAAEKELLQETQGAEDGGSMYSYSSGYGQEEKVLYKDRVLDEEVAKEVCEKYNLDYDTVLDEDVTREMRNYEEALWLIKDMGECPLLDKGVNVLGISSLEVYICEIYAFDGGAEVIKDACMEFGIDPNKTVIQDLTAEQLIQIGEEAYETSDHPKGWE